MAVGKTFEELSKATSQLAALQTDKRFIKMTMEDSKPTEAALENKQQNKKKSKNAHDKEENNSKGNSKKKIPKKKDKSAKENDKDAETSPSLGGSSDAFAFHEIANNKEASALINDLVRCFTCNSTLPQKELDVLNKTLYEKTVSVFLQILNNCVEKIFNKLLNGGFLNSKNVVKKDAFCQTDISYGDS